MKTVSFVGANLNASMKIRKRATRCGYIRRFNNEPNFSVTVLKAIELTKDKYGNEQFTEFFKETT